MNGIEWNIAGYLQQMNGINTNWLTPVGMGYLYINNVMSLLMPILCDLGLCKAISCNANKLFQ
jgi:hypothetical protein